MRHPQVATIFVSHASEDRDAVAVPLAQLCAARGLSAWVDQTHLRLGVAPRHEIDRALSACDLGVVIVSRDYINKAWPQRELDALLELNKPILVVRHGLSHEQVRSWSPLVAARVSVSTQTGLDGVVDKIGFEVVSRTEALRRSEPIEADGGLPLVALRGGRCPIVLQEVPLPAEWRPRRLWVAETVVTQEQFETVAGTNDSCFRGAALPVEMVSWFDAIQFANKLSGLEGRPTAYSVSGTNVRWDSKVPGFRLLTSAEWEWSCRAGSGAWWALPARGLDYLAWTSRNSRASTLAAGSLSPNPWGLYDTLGLVWEWVWGSTVGGGLSEIHHVSAEEPIGEIRGGGFRTPAAIVTPSLCREIACSERVNEVGFRVALST